ncbi:hypothetical protein AB0I22_20430 [Streptomyces sp. NPDC050610]|uniref:hypothetical protein n=1 Tax=Streptomyces sp. NPDC050610 TaxID=3157097 RepID=UPI0034464F8C
MHQTRSQTPYSLNAPGSETPTTSPSRLSGPRKVAPAAAALATALLLAGCSQERDAVTKWPPATHNPQSISAHQLGDAWPITPQKGTVSCVQTRYSGFAIIFTTPDGKQYALNNVAHDEKGLPSADTLKASSKTKTMWRLRTFGMQVCSVERAKHMQPTPRPTAE